MPSAASGTTRTARARRRTRWVAAVLAALAALSGPARSEPAEGWSVTGFAAVMTDDVWEDAIRFWGAEYLDSYLVGIGAGYERRLGASPLTLGLEAQLVKHFGRQSHLEVNLPVVLRRYPPRPLIPPLRSYAFGIGLSYASEEPQVEIDRRGVSTNLLIYWMGEVEFSLPREDMSLVARIHHRSDAYGLMAAPSGSNALALGLRWRF